MEPNGYRHCDTVRAPEGTICYFSNFCPIQIGECNGSGQCVQTNPPVYSCPARCTSCSESLDMCLPINCDDGDRCNGLEWCDPTVPEPSSPCRSSATGPLVCNDGNVCNGSEGCNPQAGCITTAAPPDCADTNPCTIDWCDPESGCQHDYQSGSCDDDNACTVGDHCAAGGCQPGTPRVCNDNNPCNGVETCNPATGCIDGTPIDCDDGIPCTYDRCDRTFPGYCRHDCVPSPVPEDFIPQADDRTFVYSEDHNLVAGVNTFDNHLKVTRYAGPINLEGYLHDAAQLYANGIADPSGMLKIYAFGVTAPSQHAVSLNGIHRGFLKPSPSCKWSASTFSIPLNEIKFPAKGYQGSPPTPRPNTISITVNGQPECLRFRGASLSVKLMSPIILIHGTNSDSEFFTRQRFAGFDGANRLGLDSQYLVVDQSINMETAPRDANAALLNTTPFAPTPDIPDVATSFGVDSIHLIAHSKGGLDVREYLELYQKDHNQQFKVLSFTTLSTPHNGSILADIVMARRTAATKASKFDFPGFPAMSGLLADLNSLSESIWGIDLGIESLTTKECGKFNIANLLPGRLPDDIIYNTVSANADCNGNNEIDASQLDEWNDLYTESVTGIPWGVNWAYQVLRNAKRVKLSYREERDTEGSFWYMRTVGVVEAEPGGPFRNDALVTVDSGQGVGSFGNRRRLVDQDGIFSNCRNHASVADDGIAALVGPWLVNVEREHGDLRP